MEQVADERMRNHADMPVSISQFSNAAATGKVHGGAPTPRRGVGKGLVQGAAGSDLCGSNRICGTAVARVCASHLCSVEQARQARDDGGREHPT